MLHQQTSLVLFLYLSLISVSVWPLLLHLQTIKPTLVPLTRSSLIYMFKGAADEIKVGPTVGGRITVHPNLGEVPGPLCDITVG